MLFHSHKLLYYTPHNLPRWWNGRHWGLKIPWGQLRAGSSPAPGIVFVLQLRTRKVDHD